MPIYLPGNRAGARVSTRSTSERVGACASASATATASTCAATGSSPDFTLRVSDFRSLPLGLSIASPAPHSELQRSDSPGSRPPI